jgi:hypothetical protein
MACNWFVQNFIKNYNHHSISADSCSTMPLVESFSAFSDCSHACDLPCDPCCDLPCDSYCSPFNDSQLCNNLCVLSYDKKRKEWHITK